MSQYTVRSLGSWQCIDSIHQYIVRTSTSTPLRQKQLVWLAKVSMLLVSCMSRSRKLRNQNWEAFKRQFCSHFSEAKLAKVHTQLPAKTGCTVGNKWIDAIWEASQLKRISFCTRKDPWRKDYHNLGLTFHMQDTIWEGEILCAESFMCNCMDHGRWLLSLLIVRIYGLPEFLRDNRHCFQAQETSGKRKENQMGGCRIVNLSTALTLSVNVSLSQAFATCMGVIYYRLYAHNCLPLPPCPQCRDHAKMAENDLVSGGHGQAGSWRGQWTGWIGSTPVQISGCGLDGALSWCGQGEGQSFLVSNWSARAVDILYACVYTCVCVYVCGHDIYIYMHVRMYLYIYAFIHVCMCMCMHICA